MLIAFTDSWMKCRLSFALVALLSAGVILAADDVSFNRDIRPILSDACFQCHGADEGQRKAGLRLQIDLLKQWIEESAEYEGHWAFITSMRPEVPEVKSQISDLKSAIRNPIDAFVRSRLEREGISPAPAADRATLIRRLSLDLAGLPPTPEEVDAFLIDTSADAHEIVVDRLLSSPRYGERMAG